MSKHPLNKYPPGTRVIANGLYGGGIDQSQWAPKPYQKATVVQFDGYSCVKVTPALDLIGGGNNSMSEWWDESRFNLDTSTDEPEAKKETAGKTRFDILFRLPGLRDVADIFTSGEIKYPSVNGDFNWRKGKGSVEYKMKLMSAALRHIFAYMSGEKLDKESGKPHLAHAACNLLMVADIEILEA